MKILVYGFMPFSKYESNISEMVVKNIKPEKNIVKIIFAVKFNRKMILDKIKKHKPDIIIGIGQCRKGEKIRIERKAFDKNKKHYQLVNLKLKKDKNSRISYQPGDFVCNYSMFVILNFLKNKKVKFAFIHIPHNFNIKKAIEFVKKQISYAKNNF